MKLLKRIFSDSIIYGVSSYLSVVAAIFLTPIYTRILLKTDYGAMDIINTWISLVVAILPLGLLNAVVRFYPDFKADPEQRKKYLSCEEVESPTPGTANTCQSGLGKKLS